MDVGERRCIERIVRADFAVRGTWYSWLGRADLRSVSRMSVRGGARNGLSELTLRSVAPGSWMGGADLRSVTQVLAGWCTDQARSRVSYLPVMREALQYDLDDV